MRRSFLVFFILIFLSVLLRSHLAPAGETGPVFELNSEDRLLVIAPHPDDETIGAGGVIQEAVTRNIPVRVLYFTNGDSNQLAFLYYRKQLILSSRQAIAMGELRQQEAIAAMKILGLSEDQLVFLGYPDYGTLSIFKKFWSSPRAYKGTLTRAFAVPYSKSLRPKAAYRAENILTDLTSVIRDFKPTKIIVNHPGDNNTDHQAAYLFTRVAMLNLASSFPNTRLYTYLIHSSGWPRPLGYHPELRLIPDDHVKSNPWLNFNLSPEQINRKKQAVLAYKSQIPYKPKYLFTFVRANELFTQVDDLQLQAQTLDPKAWEHLDAAQELKRHQKLDTRHNAVLRSVVYGLEPGRLVVKIKLNQWSHLGFDINLYLFGYRQDAEFSSIPKYRLRLTDDHSVTVFDGARHIDVPDVTVRRQGNDFYISVPIEALKNPSHVIASASVRIRNWPEEFSIWTILRLSDG